MTDYINSFTGAYSFLSNNYILPVTYNNITYTCAKAAYEAQKCPSRAKEFSELRPSEADILGHKVPIVENWDDIKDAVMAEILTSKFLQNEYLRDKLIDTGEAKLVYKNTWHQNYWGMCSCKLCQEVSKQNKLGLILMDVRRDIGWYE